MRILVADDDRDFCAVVEMLLAEWGYESIAASDGETAWQILQTENPPALALLDWMMPGLDGLELCRRVRANFPVEPPYLILLTARGSPRDLLEGLESGADEYLTKPIEMEELQARVRTGLRIASLQRSLAQRVQELENALARVQQLQGLLPICSWCKKVRDDQNYWRQVDEYLTLHSDMRFSHGICPECLERIVQPELERLAAEVRENHEGHKEHKG